MDQPEENPRGYKQASLFTHAENLEGDLLLIHGTVDDVVVMQHNLALVQKFIELGIQMDFFPTLCINIMFTEEIGAFDDKNLKLYY